MSLTMQFFSVRRSKKSVLLSFCFLFLSTFGFSQTVVTKNYTAGSSVSIDGCGTYCSSLPGVTFSAADFVAGACQVTDVNVNIVWAKTDGTCTAPGIGSSYHSETSFRIDGPTGNQVILAVPGTWTGNATMSSVSTTFNQGSTVAGGVTPVTGTFGPNNGNLNTFNGTSPFGTWYLRAGDTGSGDPLCIVGYSVTVTVSTVDASPPVPVLATLPTITAQCQVNSLPTPSATDNCGIVSVTNNVTLPITFQGSTIVTWTYNDGHGNTSTQNQTVVIDDNIAPVPTIPTLPNITSSCSVTSLTPPTATDNCGSVTVTNNATLPITTQGTTVVTWSYNDGHGNISTQTQNIIIDDNTAPTPNVTPLSNVTASCSVTSLTPPTATDNCGGIVTVTNDATLPITTQGTTVVTWTYTDANGNSSTQTQNIVVDDNVSPVPSVPVLSNVTAQCEVTSLTSPTATDNCGGIVTVTNDATLPITTSGTTIVTWTYTDVNGNTSTQTQNIIINDNIGPVPDVPTLAAILSECEVTSLTPPTATDNCGGIVTVTNDAILPISGSTTITWTYTDVDGNTSTQTQNVVVNDNTAPVPDLPTLADVTGVCDVTSLTDPTATDNCGSVTVTNDAILPITTQGTTVVTWTYDDGNGNTTTQTQNVVLNDNVAPIAVCQNITVNIPAAGTAAIVASSIDGGSTDNCGTISLSASPLSFTCADIGANNVTLTVDDGNGNISTCIAVVTVVDAMPPSPTLGTLPDVTATCEVTSLTDPTAIDNCGTVTVSHDATLPITTSGTTVVTWTYDDGNGNTITQTQNVVITDLISPTPDVAVLADVTAECEVTSLTAPTATDNCGGTVTVTNDATLPINIQGTTVVTWTYTDVAGNSSTQTQNIVITDVTPPVADLAVLADVTAECEITSLTYPTATDNCGGMVLVTNDASLPISIQGTTIVTWTYTDLNGNSSTQTQNVVITDVTAPVPDIAALADVTAECEVLTLVNQTATDNCGGIVTVTNDASLPISTQGTTIVTWTYTDANGNSSTQTQNVVITDVTAPVADVGTLVDVTAECEVTSLANPTATDNCGGMVTVTNDASLPINTSGLTVVTWTYTDAAGNSSTQTQSVIINDVTPPVADLATLANVTAACEVTSLTHPTATDNCGGTVTVTNDASLPISTQGTTIVTWTYTDIFGNSSTQTQNIVITDVSGPVADAFLPDLGGVCSVDAPTSPTATDVCAGTVIGTTTTIFPVTTIGTTIVVWEYADGNGNVTTQTQDIVISGVDVTTTLSMDGATITANNGLATYQWIDCSTNSPVIGSISQDFTPAVNGSYAVIVTEGSCVDTSACVTVSTIGIESLSIVKMTVYPNPSLDGFFTVNYDGTIEAIEILDMSGRIIDLPIDLNSGFVDGSKLEDGQYIVRVKTENGYAISEIVITD